MLWYYGPLCPRQTFFTRTYKLCKPREWLLSTVCPPIRTCGIAIDRPQSSIFSLHQVMPWSRLQLYVTWDLLCLLPEMSCLLTGWGCVMGCPASPRSHCSVCRQWYSKILGTKAITQSQIMQVMICWLQCMLSQDNTVLAWTFYNNGFCFSETAIFSSTLWNKCSSYQPKSEICIHPHYPHVVVYALVLTMSAHSYSLTYLHYKLLSYVVNVPHWFGTNEDSSHPSRINQI